ncbi:unnamed protein product [Prorocentrum cordatum]|uniref:Uncharacterized protein n=1 Tax=Prorocentrum cordatum TaxID=2364126 RepID=A0ABN9SMP3_9DINO|nr:unnamed protein product [Polarella glacialis]
MCLSSQSQTDALQRLVVAEAEADQLGAEVHLSNLGMMNSSAYGDLWNRLVSDAGLQPPEEAVLFDLTIVRKSHHRLTEFLKGKTKLSGVAKFLANHDKPGTVRFPVVNLLSSNPPLSVWRFSRLTSGMNIFERVLLMLDFHPLVQMRGAEGVLAQAKKMHLDFWSKVNYTNSQDKSRFDKGLLASAWANQCSDMCEFFPSDAIPEEDPENPLPDSLYIMLYLMRVRDLMEHSGASPNQTYQPECESRLRERALKVDMISMIHQKFWPEPDSQRYFDLGWLQQECDYFVSKYYDVDAMQVEAGEPGPAVATVGGAGQGDEDEWEEVGADDDEGQADEPEEVAQAAVPVLKRALKPWAQPAGVSSVKGKAGKGASKQQAGKGPGGKAKGGKSADKSKQC